MNNDGIKLLDLIDASMLQKIQDEFSSFSGMAALTTDQFGTPLTKGSNFTKFCFALTRNSPEGHRRCENCDKMGAIQTMQNGKVSIYKCHAGLVDFAAPIIVEGRFIGSFIGGQVLTEDYNESEIRRIANELEIDEEEYIDAIKEINLIPRKDVEKNANFLGVVASILSNMAFKSYQSFNLFKKSAHEQNKFIVNLNNTITQKTKKWMEDTNTLLETKDTPQLYTKVRELYDMIQVVQRNLSDSNEYLKLIEGQMDLSETIYDIRELLKFLWEKVVSHNGDEGNKFVLNVDDQVPEKLFGNSSQISQVVLRLLENSLFSCKNGKIEINVKASKREYATEIEISVSDTGNGMTQEQIQEVNNALAAKKVVDMNNTEAARHSFLIIGTIVRQLSGRITVHSMLNCGTVITVCFPQMEEK